VGLVFTVVLVVEVVVVVVVTGFLMFMLTMLVGLILIVPTNTYFSDVSSTLAVCFLGFFGEHVTLECLIETIVFE